MWGTPHTTLVPTSISGLFPLCLPSELPLHTFHLPKSTVLHYSTKKMLYQHQSPQMWFIQIASYQQLNSNWHPSASEEQVSSERWDRFRLKQTTIRTCADSKRTHTKSNKDSVPQKAVWVDDAGVLLFCFVLFSPWIVLYRFVSRSHGSKSTLSVIVS